MEELKKSVFLNESQFKQKYNSIFEKWTSKNAHDDFGCKELFWVLLAELIERAPNDKLKEINQRVQARIIYASRKTLISLGFMHFIRVSLLKCPKLLVNNAETFNSLAISALDFVGRRYLSGENVICSGEFELAMDILFRVTGFKFSDLILGTIQERLVKNLDANAVVEQFPMDLLKEYNFQNDTTVVVFLWMIHQRLVNKAKKGSKLDLMLFLKAFEASMESKNTELQNAACDAIIQLSHSIGSSFCVISSHIIRSLNKDLNISNRLKFTVLKKLNENLGIGSNIYRQFTNFSRQLIGALKNSEDPENQDVPIAELIHLIISILKNSRIFLNAKHITELQTVVCTKALDKRPSIEMLKLLNALLMFNHDLVPFPLEIAHSVFHRNYSFVSDTQFLAELDLGVSLCEVFARPQISTIQINLQTTQLLNYEENGEEVELIGEPISSSNLSPEVVGDEDENDITIIDLEESDVEESVEKVVPGEVNEEVIDEENLKNLPEEVEEQGTNNKIPTVQEIMSCFYLE